MTLACLLSLKQCIMFLICHGLSGLQVAHHFLECTRCGTVVHPACLTPPLGENADCDWYCVGCGEKTSDYQVERRRYFSVVSRRLNPVFVFY